MRVFNQGMLWVMCIAAWAWGHEGTHVLVERKSRQIEHEPTNARLLLERAELYRDHRDWDEALADYQRAAALNPALVEVALGQGRLFFEAGWHHSAVVFLEAYLAQRPDDSKGRRSYAAVLNELGRGVEAVEAYARAIREADTFDPDLYLERARAQRGLGTDHDGDALRGLDEGMAAAGHPVVALQLAAIEIELEQARFEPALERLQTLTDASPRKAHWLARKGEILELAGRRPEARAAYASACAEIEALPLYRRRVPAVLELEAQLRAAMESVGKDNALPEEGR